MQGDRACPDENMKTPVIKKISVPVWIHFTGHVTAVKYSQDKQEKIFFCKTKSYAILMIRLESESGL